MRKLKRILAVILLLFVEAGGIVMAGQYLKEYSVGFRVQFEKEDSERFRQQKISDKNIKCLQKLSKELSVPPIRILAAGMASNRFDLGDEELEGFDNNKFEELEDHLHKNYEKEYEELLVQYGKIWQDVKYFPIPVSKTNREAVVSFENSWMYERNFGGKRGHEGTDIMAGINQRGYYPVVSMTDGVVEKIGWLTKGGYRIGIRSPSGGYYYYAHLYQYAEDFQAGDTIQAGQLIGYMGDSGYGSEGTVGQFAVHLHVGIYINGENGAEISVNPYPVLKYFEQKTLQYSY